MTNPSAKDLLVQADQLMRRSRDIDDLPVLTELIVETAPQDTSRLPRDKPFDDLSAASVHSERERREPSFGDAAHTASRAGVRKESSEPNFSREQFDQAVQAKLEQMQHSVYSQVMQQLELHSTGEMKRLLREALEPALFQVSRDIAAQVAEETSAQVQQIVANAVENEVARLREQIQNKRRERDLG
jgi:hypothetical protein